MRIQFTLVVVLILAGASSTCAPAAPGPARRRATTRAPEVEGPPYEGLFVPGASWTYRVTFATSRHEPTHPRADAQGFVQEQESSEMRCRVKEILTRPGHRLSHLACDDREWAAGSPHPLVGHWIATRHALHFDPDESERNRTMAEAVASLPQSTSRPPILLHRPRVGKVVRYVRNGRPSEAPPKKKGAPARVDRRFGESTEVFREGPAWCVTHREWADGETTLSTLCFDRHGIVRAETQGAAAGAALVTLRRVHPSR